MRVACSYNSPNYDNNILRYHIPASINKLDIHVAQNYKLSEMDKAFVTINYPPDPDNANKMGWTLDKALSVAGLTVMERRVILERYRNGEGWLVLRQDLKDWCYRNRAPPRNIPLRRTY